MWMYVFNARRMFASAFHSYKWKYNWKITIIPYTTSNWLIATYVTCVFFDTFYVSNHVHDENIYMYDWTESKIKHSISGDIGRQYWLFFVFFCSDMLFIFIHDRLHLIFISNHLDRNDSRSCWHNHLLFESAEKI